MLIPLLLIRILPLPFQIFSFHLSYFLLFLLFLSFFIFLSVFIITQYSANVKQNQKDFSKSSPLKKATAKIRLPQRAAATPFSPICALLGIWKKATADGGLFSSVEDLRQQLLIAHTVDIRIQANRSKTCFCLLRARMAKKRL